MITLFFDYIDTAKNLTIFNSYRKIADYLDAQPVKISQWRQGKGYVSPCECVLLARLLGIKPEEIAFVLKAQSVTSPDEKTRWLKEAKKAHNPISPPKKFLKI